MKNLIDENIDMNNISPNPNEHIINKLWVDAFISEFQNTLNLIERAEGKSLPFSTAYLSSLLVEDLVGRNESLKKWAEIFGSKIKKNTHRTTIENKKMKIVFVTGVFPGTGHGGGLRAFDLIHELSLSGHEVHLYTSDSQLEPGEATDFLKSLCKTCNIVEAQNFTITNFEGWLESNDHHFDIAYYIWPWTVNLFPKNRSRIKKVAFEYIECTVRRLWLDLQAPTTGISTDKIKTILFDFLTHYYCEVIAAKEADILISVTEKDARFIKSVFLDSESTVITTGLSRFEFQDVSQVIPVTPFPSACFIGNYFHYPNLDGLAWYLNYVHDIVLRSVPEYKFAILGKGNQDAIDQFKIKYQHFAASLVWMGPFDKVVTAVAPYTVCLSPLISGAGLRGKVIQYSALRKATVSTNIGICGTPFVHGESIWASDDPTEFAEGIIKLITDTHFRNEMSNNAYAITEKHFSWSASIQKLENFFQKGTK